MTVKWLKVRIVSNKLHSFRSKNSSNSKLPSFPLKSCQVNLSLILCFRVSQDKRELEKFGNSPFVGLNLVLENPDKNCIKKIRKGDKLWVIKQQRIINVS